MPALPQAVRRVMWFVALWVAGVSAVAVVAMLLRGLLV